MDVPVEGSNEELAVQQTPGHHSSWSVQGTGVDGLPCMGPLGAARVCLCQRHDVCVVAALSCPQALLWGGLSRLQRCRRSRSRKQLLSVSDRSETRPRAMHPGSISGGVWSSPDAGGAWKLRLVQQELSLLALLPLMCPARLEAADACVLITILCWPDGWPHGADSIWQACNDATQCAQAAGPRTDDILVRGLAAQPPRSGVKGAS